MTATPAPQPTLAEAFEALMRERRYPVRFAAVYGFLATLLVGVTASLLVLGRTAAPSGWRPDPARPLSSIAAHVAHEYGVAGVRAHDRLTTLLDGKRAAVTNVALAGRAVTILPAEGTISYTLCGYGPGCTILTRADAQRVERETRALVRDTFRFTRAQAVVVFPPAPFGALSSGAFFARRDAHVAYRDYGVVRLQAGGAMLVLRPSNGGSGAGV
jgi:hypothetical protein